MAAGGAATPSPTKGMFRLVTEHTEEIDGVPVPKGRAAAARLLGRWPGGSA